MTGDLNESYLEGSRASIKALTGERAAASPVRQVRACLGCQFCSSDMIRSGLVSALTHLGSRGLV